MGIGLRVLGETTAAEFFWLWVGAFAFKSLLVPALFNGPGESPLQDNAPEASKPKIIGLVRFLEDTVTPKNDNNLTQ